MARKPKLIIVQSDLPYGSVRRAAAQLINHNTQTIVQWDTILSENGINYDAVNFGYTVSLYGMYCISAYIQYVSIPVAANIGTGIRINGVVKFGAQLTNIAAIAGLFSASFMTQNILLNPGDFINIQTYQNSGIARNIQPDAASNRVSEFSVVGLTSLT